MCVICIKPKGVDMPSENWIENMWYSNPDGAGFMYATGKTVKIEKGFMTLKDFNRALSELGSAKKLKEKALVMHFRIGTAGGNIPANTHPFPISDSIPVLQKLTCSTMLGIVHNGIIPITTRQKDISDTMEYIASQLAPLFRYDNEFYRSKELLQMIGNFTGSKLAFMNPQGEIFTVGSFTEDSGLLFSNTSYLSGYWYRRTPVKAYGLSSFGYNQLYDEWYDRDGYEYMDDLQLLGDGDYFVDLESGDFFDADDGVYFVDVDGFLYVYDDYLQCCMPVAGDYAIYNKEGLTFRYNADKAAPMIVLDEDVDINQLNKLDETEHPKDDQETPF